MGLANYQTKQPTWYWSD